MADLFLYDSSDSSFVLAQEKLIAKGMAGITDKPQGVNSWDAFAKAVLAHSTIGHLALHFHGNDGQMMIDGDMRWVGERSVTELFTKAKTKAPTVETISFLGCNVGNGPHQMAIFGKLFGAKAVSGYTWYTVNQGITVKIPKGTDEAKIRAALAPYADYSAAELPNPMALAKIDAKKGDVKVEILAFYGSLTGTVASTLPIPLGESRTRKAWKEAGKTTVTAKEAEAKKDEFVPSPPFEYVTVTP